MKFEKTPINDMDEERRLIEKYKGKIQTFLAEFKIAVKRNPSAWA